MGIPNFPYLSINDKNVIKQINIDLRNMNNTDGYLNLELEDKYYDLFGQKFNGDGVRKVRGKVSVFVAKLNKIKLIDSYIEMMEEEIRTNRQTNYRRIPKYKYHSKLACIVF